MRALRGGARPRATINLLIGRSSYCSNSASNQFASNISKQGQKDDNKVTLLQKHQNESYTLVKKLEQGFIPLFLVIFYQVHLILYQSDANRQSYGQIKHNLEKKY